MQQKTILVDKYIDLSSQCSVELELVLLPNVEKIVGAWNDQTIAGTSHLFWSEVDKKEKGKIRHKRRFNTIKDYEKSPSLPVLVHMLKKLPP